MGLAERNLQEELLSPAKSCWKIFPAVRPYPGSLTVVVLKNIGEFLVSEEGTNRTGMIIIVQSVSGFPRPQNQIENAEVKSIPIL